LSKEPQHARQKFLDNSEFNAGNQTYLEQEYARFLLDPDSVDMSLQQCFNNIVTNATKTASVDINTAQSHKQAMVHNLINNYRLFGHLYSNINPLMPTPPPPFMPELEPIFYRLSKNDFATNFDVDSLYGMQSRTLKQILQDLKTVYCGSIATEFMHIPDSPERLWVQDKLESTLLNVSYTQHIQVNILEVLIATEGLEKYLAAQYPGAKRYGIEGCDSLLVALDSLIQYSGSMGMQEVVLGMAHRGRLNVLINVLGKNPKELFDEFEGKHSKEVESGDVKYHQGFSSDVQTLCGNVHLSLSFNPSHLEIVNPVMCGSVRARQEKRNAADKFKVLPIAIHGDSSIAGQGVVMETFNMSQTPGYGVGGTVHIIVNNQIGFTTSDIKDTRSTLYCSDIGKMMQLPIFHVNANDPEAVFTVAKIALDYRAKFNKDVIIDLVGYRRLGHNEADEPSVTQPLMYQLIRNMPTVVQIYSEKLIAQNVITESDKQDMTNKYKKLLDEREHTVARNLVGDGWKSEFTADWTSYYSHDWRVAATTSIELVKLKQIANKLGTLPSDLKLHARVEKIMSDRAKMTLGELPIDWGYAENLAYATILLDGYKIRLSGQDCGRGTFFHRHAVLHDQDTDKKYIPLNNIGFQQAKFQVINSLLSESAVLGFDYGYSSSEPRALVIWEAQFGDFANGAQVVIDQFISSGEQKWGRLSGITMFLPHGYQGQGPEHSSARLERYLQLCAQHNIQVCVPSTPAQVYHMLRRQVLRPLRKPLIVLTPKNLLRHKLAVSTFNELADGEFLPIIGDNNLNLQNITRIILCSGKIYYELQEKRLAEQNTNIAIIRLEQLYPFPEIELKYELAKYSGVPDVVWCQEEPENQGGWYSIQHRIRNCLAIKQNLQYAGRAAAAAPAVGYSQLHMLQQSQVVLDAFGNT
jgi:2-oxoglutarate dehydrogenase E1 component